MKYFLLACVLSSFALGAQSKISGFYKPKGEAIIGLGFGFEDYYEYLGGKKETHLQREGQYTNLFASYGITKNLNIQTALPYMEVGDNKDFQDISIALKYQFYKTQNNRLQLSLGLGFSTPMSDYEINDLNDIGQQATIIGGRILVLYKLKKRWFTSLQTGYSYKFDITPNSFPLSFKIGKAIKGWYFDAYYDYQYSFGGADYRGTPAPRSFKELGVNYNKIGGSIYKSITKTFGAYIGGGTIISGRNTFLGNAYAFGLIYKFKTFKPKNL